MKTNLTFDLIDGTFQPFEAKTVLFTLIKDKINFHEQEIFSANERFGADLPHSKRRIKDLNEALTRIEEVINEIEKFNYEIKISGTIEIVAVEKFQKNEVF